MITVRTIEPDEQRGWLRSEQRSFGIEPDDQRLAELHPAADYSRAVAAFDGDDIVSTGGAYATTLSLPGGTTIPVGAITAIGTRPTHLRQGLFRDVMNLLHQQSAAQGEAATVLLASESLLYPRFGYGVATTAAGVALDRRQVEFRSEISASDRLTTYVDVAVSGPAISAIWDRVGAVQPGWLGRPDRLRQFVLADHEIDREGAMPYTLVVHRDDDGSPDGYCLFRRSPKWEDFRSAGTLHIDELVAPDPSVRLALWRHCLAVDLVETVTAFPVPTDDPLPDALRDRRQYRTTGVLDQLWIRLHHPPTALAARTYAVDDHLVVDAGEAGTFEIEGGPEGATCRPSTARPEMRCGRAELGSLAVGNSVRPLVATGRVTLDGADVDRVDRFFRSPVAPFNLLDF